MRILAVVSLAGSMIFSTSPAREAARWEQTSGPPGGNILSLALKGAAIFAGTEAGGVFRSDDCAATWKAANIGLPPNASVSCFAVSGTKVFAGTFDDGVFVSSDDGLTWVPASFGLAGREIYGLAVCGTDVFAGLWHEGAFRSSDDGASWMPANSGLRSEVDRGGITVYCLMASGSDIYAGTNTGLYVSRNRGASWVSVGMGKRSGSVDRLAAAGADILARDVGYGARVFRSADNGATWTEITSKFPSGADIQCFATDGTDFLAGGDDGRVYVSKDGGKSWRGVKSRLPDESEVDDLVAMGPVIVAGTRSSGILRSLDKGATWNEANRGLAGSDYTVLSARGTTLYSGAWLSRDGGASWDKVGSEIPGADSVWCLADAGNDLFAGTDAGIFVSRDGGASWKTASRALKSTSVYDVVVKGTALYAATGRGVLVSRKGGTDWKAGGKGPPATTCTVALALKGNDLYASVLDREINFLFVSRDDGVTWTEVKLGPGIVDVVCLVGNGKELFIAATGLSDQLFKRTDRLITTVYQACGVLRAADDGSGWQRADKGLPADFVTTCFELSGAEIFAGTWGAGVFMSTDNGANWTAVTAGLGNTRIHDLAICGEYLYASTHYGGVWRLPLKDLK